MFSLHILYHHYYIYDLYPKEEIGVNVFTIHHANYDKSD